MTGALFYLTDRHDERVKTALTRTCTICKATPDNDCRNPWDLKPLPLGRIVHLCRVQSHLDRKGNRDD